MMKKGIPVKTIYLFFILSFIVFIVLYEGYSNQKIRKKIDEHARIVSEALWHINPEGASEYLATVASHNDYMLARVLDDKGNMFVEVGSREPSGSDKFLKRWNLIRQVHLRTKVFYENEVIGSLDVIWYKKTVYLYTYILLVGGLVLVVLQLYNRILKEKQTLEHKVEVRTADLGKMNIELQKSEQKYRRLVETLREDYFFYSHGTDGVFTYLSPSIKNVLGYSQEDFLAHYTKYLTDNPVNRKVRYHTSLSIKGEQQPPYKAEIFHKDGTVHWLEVTEVPVFDEEGNVTAVEGIAHDITESKQAEDALRVSEDKFSKAFRSSPTLISICTLNEGRYMEVNDAFINISGYKREEVVDRTYSELGIWTDPAGCEKAAARLRELGKINNIEMTFRTKAGGILTMLFSAEIIDMESRRCILAVMLDITERKRLENQLLHSQKLESIGTFAGGIAHDFRNILTTIISFTFLLSRKVTGDNIAGYYVEQIQLVADNAAALIRDLLAFGRKQQINPVALDINRTMSKLEKLLLRIIGEDIELNIKLSAADLNIMVDSGRLQQVMMNLVINARDAMPGGGLLTITTDSVQIDNESTEYGCNVKPGRYVVITISDTGIGMDKKTREKIFEPFYTTKIVDKGMGLGLSIVYGIIRQHNGFINIYSAPGEGTTFRLYFPFTEQPAEDFIDEEPDADIPSGTETILVAEDDDMVRNTITSFLEEFGYNILPAKDGDEALKKFMGNKDLVRLVISDVIMPKKNGKELYYEIHRENPDMKLLFLSGHSRDKMYRKYILQEGIEIIPKPVNPKKLLRKIRATLDMR